MKQAFSSLSIKYKLLAAFISILLLSVFPLIPAVLIASKTVNEKVQLLINRLEAQELQIKNFIYEGYKDNNFQETGTCISITKFKAKQKEAQQVLDELVSRKLTTQENQVIEDIEAFANTINTSVDSLSLLLKKRGFKDYGLEGSLRKAIHEVENSDFKFDLAALLTLRRNEKDFFLRKDLKYIQEFNDNFELFKNKIDASKDPRAKVISNLLENYKEELQALTSIELKIGLKSNEGLQGKINNSFNSVWPKVDWLAQSIRTNNQQEIDQLNTLMKVMFCLQLFIGALLGIFYANLITKPIKQIKGAIQNLAEGVFPTKLTEGGKDEIGTSKTALNQFLDRLKASTLFAQELGEGNLKATYKATFKEDVMAKSLLTMQQKLNEAELKQIEINWAIQGIAAFGEIAKNESQELPKIGQEMLVMIVRYLAAQQGALFILENNRICRFATYAYERTTVVKQCFEIGDGYVGQCFKDNETLVLDNFPANFMTISSGLGKSKPVTLILVPIRTNKEVIGVMELATFQRVEDFQREFLEKIAERIALILYNKRNTITSAFHPENSYIN